MSEHGESNSLKLKDGYRSIILLTPFGMRDTNMAAVVVS